MSELEKIEADYKEAFYVLACLVNGGEFDEAKKYVASFLRRPTWRAVDASPREAQSDELQGLRN